MPNSVPSPLRCLCVPRPYRYQDMLCMVDCGVWYSLLSGTEHTDIIAFSHNNSRKWYKYTLQCRYIENTTFLALNLGLKYEIQLPNIGGGGKCIVAPQTKLLGSMAHLIPLSHPPCNSWLYVAPFLPLYPTCQVLHRLHQRTLLREACCAVLPKTVANVL